MIHLFVKDNSMKAHIYGGHNNRKQDGYHFHRGPLAGNHYASKSEMLNALSRGNDNKASVAPVPPRSRQTKEGLKNEK